MSPYYERNLHAPQRQRVATTSFKTMLNIGKNETKLENHEKNLHLNAPTRCTPQRQRMVSLLACSGGLPRLTLRHKLQTLALSPNKRSI